MKRRSFISATTGAIGGAAAASSFPAPAIAQESREWTMVTTWPAGFPGLGTGAARFAQRVTEMSGGRLTINVYGAGELVPAFEAFDAVTGGTADLFHGTPYYWQGRSPAFNFFTSAPYALTVGEHDAWIRWGGGQELWDEFYDGYGLKGFMSGNTSIQMGGWFPNELSSLDDIQGLSFRTAGLGGEVWRRVGMNVQTLPGGEIYQALDAGTLDAAEWVGPWNDLALGLHRVNKFYYGPSMIEPSAATEITVDKAKFEELPSDLKMIVRAAADAENNIVTAEFNQQNIRALDVLINEHDVQLREWPDDITRALAEASAEVVGEVAENDEMTGRIVDSLASFRESAVRWAAIGEQSFAATRLLDIPFPR